MKRDLDLIRDILIAIEANDTTNDLTVDDIVTDEHSAQEVSYHLKLLSDCNYIKAKMLSYVGCPYDDFWIERLTSSGHDYLDSVRDQGIWTETKERVASAAVSAPLEIIKQVAVSILSLKLGI